MKKLTYENIALRGKIRIFSNPFYILSPGSRFYEPETNENFAFFYAKELNVYLEQGNRVLDALGYTDHSQ